MCGRMFILCALVLKVLCRHQLPDCKLDVFNRENEKNVPILLYNHTTYFEQVVPEKGIVNLKTGEAITLACTGRRNYLTATNSNTTYATCVRGSTLRIVRRNLNFDDLECKKDIRGDVRNLNTKCANGEGHISEIGYQITRNWVNLIRICYNKNTGVTYYTEHVLNGREIKYSPKFTDRPSFSTEGLGANIAASVAYTKVFQKSTFNKLLRSARLAERYINDKSYLARGHLSPASDFLVTTSKRASYYFLNVCPQWQVINGGNWKSVESRIRKTAESYNRTFRVITGTYGVLSLLDINNNLQPLHLLSGDKLPIPSIVWKILYDNKTQLGIAIIVLNNPFLTRVSQDDLLCENICDRYGWSTRNWNDISRGYVYCCELKEFLKVVHTTPFLTVRGVLYGIS